jgi:hypothetical protein
MERAIRNKVLEITSPAHRKEDFASGRRGDKPEIRTLYRAQWFLFACEQNNLQK